MVGREFGNGVRTALRQAGLTGNDACELLGWDHAKISDMVNGKGGVTEVEVGTLLGLCRVEPAERRHLLGLFVESYEKGWLQFPDSGVPDQVRTLIEQEQLANDITGWCMNIIPGLLQTSDYIRAAARKSVTAGDIEALIEARRARLAVLDRPREFDFFIHEQALRLPVGGADIMADQLHHLLRISVRPYVTLRVVPIAIGAHAGLAGSFTRLKFPKFEPVVFVESLNAGLFLEDKASIALYDKAVTMLDQDALDEGQSRELITSIVTRRGGPHDPVAQEQLQP